MSETTKKTRKKINVIDVIIILLVLALIGTAVYKVYSEISSTSSNKHSKYIVSFRCDSEYESLLKYLNAGDALYCSANDILIGYLYDVPGDDNGAVYKIEDGTQDADESEKSSYLKTSFKGTFRLSSNVVKAEKYNYYSVEEMNISKGSTIEVYTEKAIFTIIVEDITVEVQ